MKQSVVLIALLFIVRLSPAQVTVSGVELSESTSLKGEAMVLNGAGVRSKYFMDLYVGSLFLPSKETNAQHIIDSDQEMMIQLDIISSLITSDKMTSAMNDGFKKSLKRIAEDVSSEVKEFKNVFKEEINKGDNFQFLYLPRTGVEVYKNKQLLTTIEGLQFKRALFGIWLGSEPADKKLKQKMIGN